MLYHAIGKEVRTLQTQQSTQTDDCHKLHPLLQEQYRGTQK